MTTLDVSLLTPRRSDAVGNATIPGHSQYERGHDDIKVDDQAMTDLDLDPVLGALADGSRHGRWIRELMTSLPADAETIRYRQEVLWELIDRPDLAERCAAVLPLVDDLAISGRSRRNDIPPLLQAVRRLSELEVYVDCIKGLAAALDTEDLGSVGLRRLRSWIDEVRSDPVFASLDRELPSLKRGFQQHKSITVGVNLDELLRPTGAVLLDVRDEAFTEQPLLRRLLGVHKPIHLPAKGGAGHDRNSRVPLSPLLEDLERLIRPAARGLAAALDRYARFTGSSFARMAPELSFYVGAARLARRLISAGLPICRPVIEPAGKRSCEAAEAYNAALAIRWLNTGSRTSTASRMVTNRISLGDEGRILIVTGPNRGGKTTFTQTVGIVQVMAQAGLFVPAQEARVSPIDQLASHFPRLERPDQEGGRLGEEAARISSLFDSATDRSLLLFNESLTSTSATEGLAIADDIIRALRVLGTRAVFTTHLHELAARDGLINEEVEGSSAVQSWVAGIEPGPSESTRTYRIAPGPPVGTSYARDIARRFGIEFRQLKDRIDRRRHGEADGVA